jgi:hypothetical protein
MTPRNLLLCFAVMSSACATEGPATSSDALPIEACQVGRTSDSFDLGQPSVQTGMLVIPVVVGGGCATHSFAICWNGSVLDSQPGQVDLALSHDAHGDHCDAALSRTLQVDLAPVLAVAHPPLIIKVTGATAQIAGTSSQATIEH